MIPVLFRAPLTRIVCVVGRCGAQGQRRGLCSAGGGSGRLSRSRVDSS